MKNKIILWTIITLLALPIWLPKNFYSIKALTKNTSQSTTFLSGVLSFLFYETALQRAADITIVMKNISGKEFVATTSYTGEYSFPNLSPGIYELRIKGWCFRKTITITSGENKLNLEIKYNPFANFREHTYPDLEQCPDDEKAFGQCFLNLSKSSSANEAFTIKEISILDRVYGKYYQNQGIYVQTVANALQEVGGYCKDGRLYHKNGQEIVFVSGPTQYGGFPPSKDMIEERGKSEKTRSQTQTKLQAKYYVIQINPGIEGILPESASPGGRGRK